MNLDAATLEKLMAFADGELELAERGKIEELVRTNEDAARVVRELGVLGDCLRVSEGARPKPAADGIADAVMAEIQSEQRTRSKVVSLSARRRSTYATVVGLVAAAAAVVVVARGIAPDAENGNGPQAEAPRVTTPVPSPAASSVAPTPTPVSAPTALASADPVDQSSNVSVIVVPGEGETASSIVIWLGEESAGGAVK